MSVIDLFHPKEVTQTKPTNSNGSAFYYLMKNGYILRVEEAFSKENTPLMIKANMIDPDDCTPMDQDQANYRVAIFRDEILEMDEYRERIFGYTA